MRRSLIGLLGLVLALGACRLDNGDMMADVEDIMTAEEENEKDENAAVAAPLTARTSIDKGAMWAGVRYWWGRNMNPKTVTSLAGDITCDGKDDLILWRINKDNPEGPFLNVMALPHGMTATDLTFASARLPFDGAQSQFGLAGYEPPAELKVRTGAWDTLTHGRNMPAAPCQRAIVISEGMTDKIRAFWPSGLARGEEGDLNLWRR